MSEQPLPQFTTEIDSNESATGDFVDALNNDQQCTEDVLQIMSTHINKLCEIASYRVKDHPKANEAFEYLAKEINAMIHDFLVDEKLPNVREKSEEELANTNAGFWMNRSKRISRKSH